MTDGKKKGNSYERTVAKQLSRFMFDDPYLLRKKGDSGSQKVNYSGDVFPEGQLPERWKRIFPFVIEAKSGYENHKPTFWKYEAVKKWFIKIYREGQMNNQTIVLLVCQFKNMKALLFTNYYLGDFQVCFPLTVDNEKIYVYAYFYKEILKYNFDDLFDLNQILNLGE